MTTEINQTPGLQSVLRALSRERLYDLGKALGACIRQNQGPKAKGTALIGGVEEVLTAAGYDPAASVRPMAPRRDGLPQEGQVLSARGRQLVEGAARTAPSSSATHADWSDIVVPPFCLKAGEDRAALQALEDEVIDPRFLLNEERAKREPALSLSAKKGGKRQSASAKTLKGYAGDRDAGTDIAATGTVEAKVPSKEKKVTSQEGQGSSF